MRQLYELDENTNRKLNEGYGISQMSDGKSTWITSDEVRSRLDPNIPSHRKSLEEIDKIEQYGTEHSNQDFDVLHRALLAIERVPSENNIVDNEDYEAEEIEKIALSRVREDKSLSESFKKEMEKGLSKWIENYKIAKKNGNDEIAADIYQNIRKLAMDSEFNDNDWDKLEANLGVPIKFEKDKDE